MILISYFDRFSTILKKLFGQYRNKYLKSIENKTPIFENRDDKQRRMKTKNIKPISIVIINEKEKIKLLEDIENFFAPQSHIQYSAYSILYQKGYLLYRPPKTGKSNLYLSIAGHFDQEIYVFNVSGVDTKSLGTLFVDLPPSCILLLKDIDIVNITQSRQAQTEINQVISSLIETAKFKLSLSDLFNIFNRISSYKGQFLLMIINHIELLDIALIRSGCTNKKIEFRNVDRDITRRLFYLVFKQSKDDIPNLKERIEDNETVNRFTNEFVRKIPELEFSPAEIQSFLIKYKYSSVKAIKKTEDQIIIMKDKKKKV